MPSYTATVIVDDKDIGGEVRLLVEGRTFILRGGVVRGLRDLEKCADVQERAKMRESTTRTWTSIGTHLVPLG